MALKLFRASLLRRSALAGALGAAIATPSAGAQTLNFDLPAQPLARSLDAYARISGQQVIYSADIVAGRDAPPLHGAFPADVALSDLVAGSGLSVTRTASGGILIGRPARPLQLAQVSPKKPATASGVETVVVTAEKKSEDVQNVPIAVSALSQKQLTERQVAGGPDLVKEVPNLTFSKTNFTGYNIEIRGIGTQAISVTTDPAVAVAFNGTPFIRNHFFEQEFYDLDNVEVLRGPQGTLYGRNATAGVVNIKSALPTGDYEAMLSADFGNYNNRRLEAMVNIPIVGDKLDLRVAGEWTKRDGYTFNESTDRSVDGRDLWSGRVTLGWKPTSDIQADLVWEHFSEDDDRLRSGKQLCEKDPGPTSVGGLDLTTIPGINSSYPSSFLEQFTRTWLSQGCLPTSLYSPNAFQTPNGQTLPFVALGEFLVADRLLNPIDPYSSLTQSPSLRTIQSLINPSYRAKNDTLEFNVNYAATPELTVTSQTGYNNDSLFSTEDFNRFDTAPGLFNANFANNPDWRGADPLQPNGSYCDPQLGCSTSLVGEDVSQEHAWQLSQEFRLSSSFSGPLNFSVGTNYLHYQTREEYYVLFNLLNAESQLFNGQSAGQFSQCDSGLTPGSFIPPQPIPPVPFIIDIPQPIEIPSALGCNGITLNGRAPATYIDTSPITDLNGLGHSYFLSENPYWLNSWAGFGEVYYNVTSDLKLTGGLRWTDDRKLFDEIPSQTFELGGGYPVAGIVKQNWSEWTGRAVATWSPELDFTDASMFYSSYAHGYKGGGANPPGPSASFGSSASSVTHPLTFKPEHVEAFELGTKNTALDGSLTLNADIFYYNYHGYQISEIVDRTAINLNFNATVKGTEVESTWEPLPGLVFNVAGGAESSAVDRGQTQIDLMDRTAGHPGWVVVRPYVEETSNCILPAAAVAQLISVDPVPQLLENGLTSACDAAYRPGSPPPFGSLAEAQAAFAAVGFNPATAPNNGEGFTKSLTGNKLPNTPPFTLSAGAQYTMPVSADWAATLRADFYWQGNSFARIFNDRPYDQIHGYSTTNLALILNSANGWQAMAYVKNVFNVTAITGDFLNSDDTALTTNVFTTDPRLFGLRITKQLGEGNGLWGDSWSGADFFADLFEDKDGGVPVVWIELGGELAALESKTNDFLPPFLQTMPRPAFESVPQGSLQKSPVSTLDSSAQVQFQPSESDWLLALDVRYGKSNRNRTSNLQPSYGSQPPYGPIDAYQSVTSKTSERHLMADFNVGKEVGLGVLGEGASSIGSVGIRYAQFDRNSQFSIRSQPTNVNSYGYYHRHYATAQFKRNFKGVGPTLSWDGSLDVVGNASSGRMTFDWGANGALLFGRQKVNGHHQTTNANRHYFRGTSTQMASPVDRSHGVIVPNLGGFAGFSFRYTNAKVSFGYRADEFFGAMDGGIDVHRSENVGFFGPFASVSLGLGG